MVRLESIGGLAGGYWGQGKKTSNPEAGGRSSRFWPQDSVVTYGRAGLALYCQIFQKICDDEPGINKMMSFG